MESIGQFFSTLGTYIEAIWEWFTSFLTATYNASIFLLNSFPLINIIVGVIPNVIGTCVLITVIVHVIKFVIGR